MVLDRDEKDRRDQRAQEQAAFAQRVAVQKFNMR